MDNKSPRIILVKYPQICPLKFNLPDDRACGKLPIKPLTNGKFNYTPCNTPNFPKECPQKTLEEFIKENIDEIRDILRRISN